MRRSPRRPSIFSATRGGRRASETSSCFASSRARSASRAAPRCRSAPHLRSARLRGQAPRHTTDCAQARHPVWHPHRKQVRERHGAPLPRHRALHHLEVEIGRDRTRSASALPRVGARRARPPQRSSHRRRGRIARRRCPSARQAARVPRQDDQAQGGGRAGSKVGCGGRSGRGGRGVCEVARGRATGSAHGTTAFSRIGSSEPRRHACCVRDVAPRRGGGQACLVGRAIGWARACLSGRALVTALAVSRSSARRA